MIYYNSKSECSLDFMLLNLDTKYLTAHANAPHAHKEKNIIPPPARLCDGGSLWLSSGFTSYCKFCILLKKEMGVWSTKKKINFKLFNLTDLMTVDPPPPTCG